jgi:hypothetical protein
MRMALIATVFAAATLCGCSQNRNAGAATAVSAQNTPSQGAVINPPIEAEQGVYRGFDRNDYPGDATMAQMHGTFTFTGYWLTNPPGENANSWMGKRGVLKQQGWGFLVLANGRLDAEILKAQKHGTAPAALAQQDASLAMAAAKAEGFPARTILFLDQEEGGVLLAEQAAYLLAWTEAVAASDYRAGVYASGQPVPDGPGKTTTTIQDIRQRVAAGHLHEIAIFDAQDSCPPAPGCTVHPKPLAASGEPNLTAWQFSQSPRRPAITKSCKATYAADGNCYASEFPAVFLDMDAASTSDPSHGR